MIRFAPFLLIAFLALLGFAAFAMTRRRVRHQELLSSQRHRIGEYQTLVAEIEAIARPATDIDPSAELILMEITKFKQKELS